MNFIDDARQIVLDYFSQCGPYELRLAGLTANRRAGIITEDYERTERINCNNQMTTLRSLAAVRLDQLADEFKDDLTRRTAPAGEELDSADFRLLRSGLKISTSEFLAICERNADKETVMRAAGEFAAAHNLLPYYYKYYRTPDDRLAAFGHIIKVAKEALNIRREYCPALDDNHWALLTKDDAKVVGVCANYSKT